MTPSLDPGDAEEITSMNVIFHPVKDYRFCSTAPNHSTMKPLNLRIGGGGKRVSIIS